MLTKDINPYRKQQATIKAGRSRQQQAQAKKINHLLSIISEIKAKK